MKGASAWAKEHIAEHEQEIKRVNQRFVPIEIEHKNGDKYLFMSFDYYEKHFVQLRVKVDEDVLREHNGDVSQMILDTTENVLFCFDIEDCREVSI